VRPCPEPQHPTPYTLIPTPASRLNGMSHPLDCELVVVSPLTRTLQVWPLGVWDSGRRVWGVECVIQGLGVSDLGS